MSILSDREDSITLKFVNDGEASDLDTFCGVMAKVITDMNKTRVGFIKKYTAEEKELIERITSMLAEEGLIELK